MISGEGHRLQDRTVSLDEWLHFLRNIDLIGADVTQLDATLAFSWSRMCVIDTRHEKGYAKDSHLPFEGFMEALCRLSAMKSLPSPAEVEEAHCVDASEYLEKLKAEDPAKWEDLVKSRATPWGDAPAFPLQYCVVQLLAIIVRSIEQHSGTSSRKLNGKLEKKEVASFWESVGGNLLDL